MEIKGVKKEKIEYPKINEISNERIKYSIPNNWLKLGVTSFLIDVLIRNKAFATMTPSQMIGGEQITGDVAYYKPIYDYARTGCNIISFISVLMFIISSIMIIYTKLKAKKQDKKIKLSKIVKIICIISIITFILSRIGVLITNYLKFG